MDKLYLVMPAYNEEANIAKVIEEWHPVVEKIGNGSKLVIVDDGSIDTTYKTMQNLQTKFQCLEPITKLNSGHGATCLYVYQYAVNNNVDWIFQTDSDGQTDPSDFWHFWQLRNQFDFIIGERTNRLDGLNRIFIAKVLQLVVWIIYGVHIKDANTPFRLMKTEKLKSYLNIIPKDFFLSNVLISTLIVLKKEKHKWTPIAFKPRQGGVNSINFKKICKIGIKAIKDFKNIKTKI